MNLYDLIGEINAMVWSLPILIAFVGVSFYISLRLKFIQFAKFGTMWKMTFGTMFDKSAKDADSEGGDISPFAALTTAMAATLGVGTIVGTATAIGTGGPGAIFWMLFAGLFAMAVKYAEIALAFHYRVKKEKGEITGGPFSYIFHAFKNHIGVAKFLAAVFAVGTILASFTLGNMIQGNSMANAISAGFDFIPQWAVGVFAMIVVALVILGGITRIAAFAEKAVPTMTVLMIGACIVAVIMNISYVPGAFVSIFTNAFNGRAAMGGAAGTALAAAVRIGVTRGVLSNEGGLGSAPIAHASAKNDHPAKQGFWGGVEVFIDTHVVCLLVSMVVLTAYNSTEGHLVWHTVVESDHGPAFLTGSPLIMESMYHSLPAGHLIAPPLISLIIFTFALTTLFGWSFYGVKSVEYLFGPKAILPYRLIFIPIVLVGTVVRVGLAFNLNNIFMMVMIVPNLIAIVASIKVINAITNNYFKKEKYVSYMDVVENGSEDVIAKSAQA